MQQRGFIEDRRISRRYSVYENNINEDVMSRLPVVVNVATIWCIAKQKRYKPQVYEESSGLTKREREIAELAAEGLRNNEIAGMLFVSENTVRAHLRSIYQKLDIDRRAKIAKALLL